LGVLDVQSRQPNDFQKEDVAILQIMADQLASNILNAQIFGESERRARLLAELQNITNLMNQQATLQNGLQVLSQQAMKLLESDGGGVFLWNEGEQKLELVISADRQMVGRRLSPGEGLAGRAFSQNSTLKVDDYAHWSGVAPAFADVTFRAALAVPLKQQEQPIGVLILTRTEIERPFNPEEVQVIDLLAAQAGAIIVNSQLVEETRRLARRERILNRITAEIRRSLDVQTVLETATRELGQTLNDKRIRVRLFASEAAEEPGNGHPVES
jgi:GAF domain-containing protein